MSLEFSEGFRDTGIDFGFVSLPKAKRMRLQNECRDRSSPLTKTWGTPVFRSRGNKEDT